MKALTLSLIVICLITENLNAQFSNANPDPNGSPWITNDASLPPQEFLDQIPVMELNPQAMQMQLPDVVDNSALIFMPPVHNQFEDSVQSNSCVQFAEIWYTFTYEINRMRNVPSGNMIGGEFKHNQYSPYFTYNFLNNGNPGSLTDYFSGFLIIMENGCPSYDIYDDPALYQSSTKFKYWMNNYDRYASGMHNRIAGTSSINFDNNFEVLKHWLANHNSNEATGGLAIISVYLTSSGNNYANYPVNSPEAEKKLIKQWSTTSPHALTLVGYHDSVFYDLNGNGSIEYDEFGAFKAVNSWGTGFGDYGYIYIPYKLMKSGLQYNNRAYVCHVDTVDYVPELSIKASVEHNNRSKIKFMVGYADNASQTNAIDTSDFHSFDYQGGSYSMRGVYTGPIEIGLDFGHWYLNNDPGKIFFLVGNKSINNGTINYFSLIDRRWDEEFELFCDQTNVTIVSNDTTTLAIDYHLLPHEQPVSSNVDITSNRVSRFTTSVENDARFVVHNNVKIDMYDSELRILSGSSLTIGNGATFHARNGNCKVVIDGSISVGENVSFLADEGATIELILNNTEIVVGFFNNTFMNCTITSFAQNLNITNSILNKSMVSSYSSDVSVHGSTFNNSTLYLENQTKNQELSVAVTGSNFNTHTDPVAIDILNYGNYLIAENTINGFHEGLKMNYCGNGIAGNQSIFGNHIFDSKGLYSSAIILYNTTGTLEMNDLHDNFYGLRLMNSCNIALYGNGSAQNQDQTQRIKDNTSYEIYSSKYSFPWYFRYNVIIDEDNIPYPFDPLLYWAYPEGSRVDQKDIRYNCWGNNFSAIDDLFPSAYFIYDPVWCPGFSGAMIDPIEDLYNMGTEQFESGNYSTAKSTFQLLIQQYPKSDYAQAAMKELVRLEEYVTSDYASLKNYLLTNDSIVADTILIAIAEILSNKCDIKLENWQQAIDWLENRIINPTCLEDSVFGIIDLGYVYFLMENQNLKSAYTGNLKQFKPATKAEFFDHRDYLLSLLPGEMMHDKDRNSLTSPYGSLLQNVPNPFTENTQIWYRVETKSSVAISITDLTGKEIQKIVPGEKDKGTYHIDFLRSNLSAGAYFYTLVLDGRKCDTRKMIIMR